MARTITFNCPVFVDAKDDVCGEEFEIDAWRAEPMTWDYPGSPAGFEVVEAPCGHAGEIESGYHDWVMEQLSELEQAARESAAEAKYERQVDRRIFGRW